MKRRGSLEDVQPGYTLVEVLIVIGIITLLIATLLPMVARLRESARATQCLANVQQWGLAYQMYVSSNRGKSIISSDVLVSRGGVVHPLGAAPWWEMLAPYVGDPKAVLYCPNAQDIRSDPPDPGPHMTAITRGAASLAWAYRTSKFHAYGSYGVNISVFELLPDPYRPGMFHFWFEHVPVHDAARVPFVSECIYPVVAFPMGSEGPATNLADPGPCNGVTGCCIDRHQRSVNVGFVDGHAERVPLAQLWHLKWSPDFRESDVYIP